MRNNKIDIWSKGEVASYLAQLADSGQIKKCKNLMLEYGHAQAYYPRCTKDWASRESARNVPIDITAYNGPSCYFWPKCPDDCPHFENTENFIVSVSRDQFDEGVVSINEETVEAQPVTEETSECDPSVPGKVTIPWLLKHVPVSMWIAAVGILFAVYVGGIKSSEISIIKEIFNLEQTKTENQENKKANKAPQPTPKSGAAEL